MKFIEVEKDWPFLIHPSLAVLLTAKFQKKDTITPIAWISPLSGDPPLLALALKETRFSYELLSKSKEFGINIPSFDLAEKVWLCGTNTGRKVDKFSLSGLTRMPGKVINAPLIKECIAFLECRLSADQVFGDHHLIVGEVLKAIAKEGFFANCYLENFSPCLHLRKNLFLKADWKSLKEV